MSTLSDPEVHKLLMDPNFAVVSTINQNGSIHSTVVWIDLQDGLPAVNSAIGRVWPSNLERNPRISAVVYAPDNPYSFVEIRGSVTATTDGADEHIDGLAKKYIGQDKYPFRQPGEQRIKFVIEPEHVRYQKQG